MPKLGLSILENLMIFQNPQGTIPTCYLLLQIQVLKITLPH